MVKKNENACNSCAGIYTKKVIDTFKNPHNYGKIKDADGIGKVGNIICGDVMWLYIKVGKKKAASAKASAPKQDFIKDIKFETFGCVAAISTSSMITDLAKGKTIKEALKITKDNIVESLGGLPKIKFHCSILAIDALIEAIYDYLVKNKKSVPLGLEKRHQIIKKDRETIEKRYAAFKK